MNAIKRRNATGSPRQRSKARSARIILLSAVLAMYMPGLRSSTALEPEHVSGVFVAACKIDGHWDLWKFSADGMIVKRLTDTPETVSDPKWSPDGERIMYSTEEDGIPYLHVMNRDGTGNRRLWDGSQGAWAPDGRSIVFQREGHIYHRRLDSDRERMLTPEDWLRCSFPSVSPDGEEFAVASRHRRVIGIYVGSIEGGEEPAEVTTRTEACTPRWRHDGKKLLYQSSSHVFEVRPDGSGERQLTFGADVQNMPVYSPDSSMIAYCRAPGGDGPWRLYVMRLEDEAETALPAPGDSCMYPDWTAE